MLGDSDKEFLDQYIETALWSSNDNADDQGGEPLDANYTRDDLSSETLDAMKADCLAFLDLADELLDLEYSQAGHDFWLTRNGHGAGFWDGDWPEHGDKLTEISKGFGEVNLYLGDNGLVYQFQG